MTELADAEVNEREMCRILGGGTPGCCQCGCHYATLGGSSTSANDSANNADGLTSDPGEQTSPSIPEEPEPTKPIDFPQDIPGVCFHVQESTCQSTI